MSDDLLPEPLPSGALVPPPRNPPTATATATAAPLPPRRDSSRELAHTNLFRVALDTALDALDRAGDTIAGAIGMR
jgi:hypothetical protein